MFGLISVDRMSFILLIRVSRFVLGTGGAGDDGDADSLVVSGGG
jgi:hypothetical protein